MLLPLLICTIARAVCASGDQLSSCVQDCHKCRLVDPSDPSKIFLTQPVSDEDRLPSAPVYASNYGHDEVRHHFCQSPVGCSVCRMGVCQHGC